MVAFLAESVQNSGGIHNIIKGRHKSQGRRRLQLLQPAA